MIEPADLLFSPRDLDTGHWFAVEPPPLLYHYTTVGGAYGILMSDTIWMTKVRYLNDTSEVEIGISTFREVLEQVSRRSGAIDQQELLDSVREGLGSFATSNICVVSFCEHGDLLSQWRWYGEGGRGLSIGVASDVLRGMARGTINLWKCIYDEQAHRALLNAMVDRLLLVYARECEKRGGALSAEQKHFLLERFFASFLQVVPIIKNPNFAEEREWRLVSLPVDPDDHAYGVSMTGDRIIQRYELRFPRGADGWCRAMGRVVVGPTKDPELIGEAIAVLCRKNKVDCRAIAYSEIPFRHH